MLDKLPSGAKPSLDAAAVIGLIGTLINVLPAVTAVLIFVWTLFRLIDTRVMKALLFRTFGFDLEGWLTANRAPAKGGQDDD